MYASIDVFTRGENPVVSVREHGPDLVVLDVADDIRFFFKSMDQLNEFLDDILLAIANRKRPA